MPFFFREGFVYLDSTVQQIDRNLSFAFQKMALSTNFWFLWVDLTCKKVGHDPTNCGLKSSWKPELGGLCIAPGALSVSAAQEEIPEDCEWSSCWNHRVDSRKCDPFFLCVCFLPSPFPPASQGLLHRSRCSWRAAGLSSCTWAGRQIFAKHFPFYLLC